MPRVEFIIPASFFSTRYFIKSPLLIQIKIKFISLTFPLHHHLAKVIKLYPELCNKFISIESDEKKHKTLLYHQLSGGIHPLIAYLVKPSLQGRLGTMASPPSHALFI